MRQDLLQNISDPSQFVSFYMDWLSNKKRFDEGKIIDDVSNVEYTMNKYMQNREEQFKVYINSASNEELNKLYSKFDEELIKEIDIKLVDHIIIGKNRYYSFLENNNKYKNKII